MTFVYRGEGPQTGRRRGAGALTALLIGGMGLLGGAGPGPDVWVGSITDTSTYGTDCTTTPLPSSAIFAYDLGTDACNIGSANIPWEANTPAHPVIAQNIYRFTPANVLTGAAGRFEQIGMSWVKHGFYASGGNHCNLGCNGVSGDKLGVGCSDPYTYGVNGLQFGLGPRSAINASTGVFAYDATTSSTWPAYTGPVARRIQVRMGDIDPASNPGAEYVGEAVYVTPDDAQAGNGWNNAAYRRMTFGADPTFTATLDPMSACISGSPAIAAWKEFDPAVQLVQVDVPGDGRVWIAERVSQNADMTWHYQIAIENLSSDRSIRSLNVGLGMSAAVTNMTMQAPMSHSGEPWSNAPWNTAGPSVSRYAKFFTDTYSPDPNANAIRWGTMYSFGFDSDLAPGDGMMSMGLFKPAPAGQGTLNEFVPYVRMQTPGGGDISDRTSVNRCATPFLLHAGVNGFSNLAPGDSGPDECTELGSAEMHRNIWFTYSYPDVCGGTIYFSTCGSDFDTKIAVYSGTNCPTAPGTALACNDEAPAMLPSDAPVCTSGNPGWSFVSVPAIPGQTYLVRVGSRNGDRGNAVLTVSVPHCVDPPGACCRPDGVCLIAGGEFGCSVQGGVYLGNTSVCEPQPCPQPVRPVNDLCANAITLGDVNVLGPSGIVRGTNTNALTDGTIACESGGRDVWYSYTPTISTSVSIDLCSSIVTDISDSVLQLLSGTCDAPTLVGCDDDTCGSRSMITANLTAGTTYLIRVMGFSGQTGDFAIKVTGGGGSLPGACCSGTICSLTLATECSGGKGHFAGPSVSCNVNGTPTCCKADFDQSGTVNVSDIFAFLRAWFAHAKNADADGSGGIDVADIFSFLRAWFAKC